ncbi:MAG: hypothetical protein M0P73_16270 [Syntrophobacterales bacterium]|jgi:hypothetical protein|nr:hypothetical protein [Syntrophobacterales bacterium]
MIGTQNLSHEQMLQEVLIPGGHTRALELTRRGLLDLLEVSPLNHQTSHVWHLWQDFRQGLVGTRVTVSYSPVTREILVSWASLCEQTWQETREVWRYSVDGPPRPAPGL